MGPGKAFELFVKRILVNIGFLKLYLMDYISTMGLRAK